MALTRTGSGARTAAQIAAGALLLTLALASACTPTPEVRSFAAGDYPQRLSDWGIIQRRGDRLVLGRNVIPYDVNTPLFSDYALKLRTVWMPAGARAQYADDAAYTFPPGALISKTFFYPLTSGLAQARESWDGDLEELDLARTQLMETRLLVRHEQGWDALAYQWRGDEAWLNITGSLIPLQLAQDGAVLETHYIVPSRSECARCHATGEAGTAVLPIGTTTRQLNRGYGNGPENQIQAWLRRGWLDEAPPASHWTQNANWSEEPSAGGCGGTPPAGKEPSAGGRGGTPPAGREPSAGGRGGTPPAGEEPSAGGRGGIPPAGEEPSAGGRGGISPAGEEPSAGGRGGEPPAGKEPSAGEREGELLAGEQPSARARGAEPLAGEQPSTRERRETPHAGKDPAPQTDHLEHLARSYLDANCGHCHNPLGPANTTGLWLHRNAPSLRRLGLCKPPIAAGQGTGGHSYSIMPGAPDASILTFRMATTDPAARMPELGRTLVHQQGLAVVSDWIASLPGECNTSDQGGTLRKPSQAAKNNLTRT